MTITCITLTCGRVEHLNEALESFLRQTYPDKELIILNTCPEQHLVGQFPRVRIINLGFRPESLGHARNLAIQEAGEDSIVCILDDDDLALSGYLDTYVCAFADNPGSQWVWLDKQFYMEHGKIVKIAKGMCNTFAFKKSAWDQVGRYEQLNVGEDRQFIGKITTTLPGVRLELPPETASYIYGWGNGVYHISGMGSDKPNRVNSWDRARLDLESKLKRGIVRPGVVVLKPAWKQDYAKMAVQFYASKEFQSDYGYGSLVLTAKQRMFHAVERHEEPETGRKMEARASWDGIYAQGVNACHLWRYKRDATDIGDKRRLPFLKDVLENALSQAGDSDFVFLTNDDNYLHRQLPDVLLRHLLKHEACCSQRCEFRNQNTKFNQHPELLASLGRKHMGRDLFAARKTWWLKIWDQMGDPILGASDWDLHLACIFRLYHGIVSTRQNLEEVMHPCEIPRGYVLHRFHQPRWAEPGNINDGAAQKWNREQFRNWAEEFLPSLKFHKHNVI